MFSAVDLKKLTGLLPYSVVYRKIAEDCYHPKKSTSK